MDGEKIINFILKEMYNAPTNDDILRIEEVRNQIGVLVGYRLYHRGIELPAQKVQNFIEQAKLLANTELFQVLLNEIEFDGSKRMAVEAIDWERTRFAKAFIYAADFIRRKVNLLQSLEAKVAESPKKNEQITQSKKRA